MTLALKIREIQLRIEKSQKRGGYSHPVELIAVTKTHPFLTIQESYNAGLKTIGENRIQEASKKFQSFKHMPNICRRFIGHLQSNKVNKCLEYFDTIDSVDSLKLAKKISKASVLKKNKTPILLEINTSQEPQKNGFKKGQIDEILACFNEPGLIINGLMTVGPNTKDIEKTRESFITLRELKNKINKQEEGANLKELSMGMSGDYEIAVEEGSSMIRLGTALYGKRGDL
jgi:pyridoxal phosphate enzyme (YggS family)|tara:strand:+ start:1862 stop:2551 length:690 start_codon:yes stop_codon:yes gene_type:complete